MTFSTSVTLVTLIAATLASAAGIETIDIASCVNRGFADSIQGDTIGGWADDGALNDIRRLPPGMLQAGSIPCRIIDPASNNGKSCIVFSDQQKGYFADTVIIPMGGRASDCLYLLHATSTVPPLPAPVGYADLLFSDGSSQSIEIMSYRDVNNWWYPEDLVNATVAWKGNNHYSDVGLYLSKHPIRNAPIASLRLRTTRIGVWMVVSVSAGEDRELPRSGNAGGKTADVITLVKSMEAGKTAAIFTLANASGALSYMRVSVPLPGAFRVQTSRSRQFDSTGAAQMLSQEFDSLPLPPDLGIAARRKQGAYVVSSKRSEITLRVTANPFSISCVDKKGRIRGSISRLFVGKDESAIGGPLEPAERLFGTGSRFNGVDQRGKIVRIWAEDRFPQIEGNSYLPVPFIMSTGGYALFQNRFEYSVFDLGARDSNTWSCRSADGAPIDLYLFAAGDPKELLTSYARITGFAPTPPAWSFGVAVSRYGGGAREFGSVKGIREVVAKHKEFDLPWTTAILEGWPAYRKASYDSLKVIVDELQRDGRKVLLYEACGRIRPERMDIPGASNAYCVHDSSGETNLARWFSYKPIITGNTIRQKYVDITSPRARTWWLDTVWGYLLDSVKVDGAKIDFCEHISESPSLRWASGRRPQGMHHWYPVAYNTLMWRNFSQRRPEGGMVWSRGGGIGAQRYPFVWCGDQTREAYCLPAILSAKLSGGFSGVPFVGNDLAGFTGSSHPHERNNEPIIFARGAQLDCFGPTMQTHGAVTQPYEFDSSIVSIFRLYSRIHYALVPYIMEHARIASNKGWPLMRHLYIEFSHDSTTWSIEDEFMLGEDFLVAPLFTADGSRRVYLPKSSWVDLFTGKEYTGPRWITVSDLPLWRMPVFVRSPAQSALVPGITREIRKLARDGGFSSVVAKTAPKH